MLKGLQLLPRTHIKVDTNTNNRGLYVLSSQAFAVTLLKYA